MKQRFCKDCRFSKAHKVEWHDEAELSCVHPALFTPFHYDRVDGEAIPHSPKSCSNERNFGYRCGDRGNLFEPMNFSGPPMNSWERFVYDVKEFFGL